MLKPLIKIIIITITIIVNFEKNELLGVLVLKDYNDANRQIEILIVEIGGLENKSIDQKNESSVRFYQVKKTELNHHVVCCQP